MRIILPFLVVLFGTALSAAGQCGTGTSASLNWDALDYLPTSGYNNNTAVGASPSQNFAFGKNRLNIQYTTTAPNAITSAGENATHTAEAGSYGAGEDVQFNGNGTITLTFDSEVSNLKFSIYDIDMAQKLRLGATNAAGVQQTITVTCLGAPTKLTLTGNNTTSPLVEDNNTTGSGGNMTPGTNVDVSSPDASINVDIAGPVKTITLTTTNLANIGTGQTVKYDSYFLSDISACSPSTFPTNYYQVSQPLAGQPAYVLEAINNSVYYVDPATGNAKLLFTDGATSAIITSMGYDPYNHMIYYVYGLVNNGASPSSSNKSLMRYDVANKTITTLVADINTLGVPTFDQGVENGGACFYDGAWYIGIDGAQGGVGNPHTSAGESVVWRLDFNSSGIPYKATQVFAADQNTNDWGDFAINDGTLYSFNAHNTGAVYHHYNLQTGANQAVPFVATRPRQCAVGYDGTVYWLDNAIAVYNGNGSIGTQRAIVSTPAVTNWSNYGTPLYNDGGEAFRPPYDFGDAPATYDPLALSPAMHETNTNLRLGADADWEWAKTSSVDASADGVDENGMTFLSAYLNSSGLAAQFQVYNNTGTTATVCAWLDLDLDGEFDPTEGLIQTVGTSTANQTVSFSWNGVSALPSNTITYLRVRITSDPRGMSVNDPIGFYLNGEVEDYLVMVNPITLPVKLTGFAARATLDGKVALEWTVSEEEAGTQYEVQKSADARTWSPFYSLRAPENKPQARYEAGDATPVAGTNYYRLKITSSRAASLFSEIRKVVISSGLQLQIAPNPARGSATLRVEAAAATTARLQVVDMSGRVLLQTRYSLQKGTNQFLLPLDELPAGLYQAEWQAGAERCVRPLVVRK